MMSLEPDIITRPERVAVIMARDFTVDRRAEIPALFDAFFQADVVMADVADEALLGISFNMDGTGRFRYGVGRIVGRAPDAIPEGFEVLTLPASDYAVFRHFGPVTDLPVLLDRIFTEWLPSSGYSAKGDLVIERYPDDDRNGPDGMAFEIWAPVHR